MQNGGVEGSMYLFEISFDVNTINFNNPNIKVCAVVELSECGRLVPAHRIKNHLRSRLHSV